MRLTLPVARNYTKPVKNWSRDLNDKTWHRRVWEVGYSGPPLSSLKRTGKPHTAVSDWRIKLLRDRFEREHQVMRWLCTPYLSKEDEAPYIEKYGDHYDQLKAQRKAVALSKMPGKPKDLREDGTAIKKFGNIGNLLHKPRTVEEQLAPVLHRWD